MRCLLLLLTLLPACSSIPSFKEIHVKDRQPQEIWFQVQRFAETRGFRADPLETDVGLRRYTSVWSHTRGGGVLRSQRVRFVAELHELEKRPPHWRIDYYVHVQRCMTPGILRPREEDWEDAGRDSNREHEFALVMHQGLRLPLGDLLRGPTR